MSNILTILKLPTGQNGALVEYEIQDAGARDLISALGDAVYWMGVTTTELTDGGTTNPIVIPSKYEAVTPQAGDNPKSLGWYEYDSQQEKYVLTNDESVQEGKTYYTTSITAKVGGMAQYSGEEFVWNGSAWQSIGKNNFGSLAFKNDARGTYTPEGSVSVTDGADTTTSVTPFGTEGTAPSWSVSGTTATFSAGTVSTAGSAVTVVTASGARTASFTGTEATITVS